MSIAASIVDVNIQRQSKISIVIFTLKSYAAPNQIATIKSKMEVNTAQHIPANIVVVLN